MEAQFLVEPVKGTMASVDVQLERGKIDMSAYPYAFKFFGDIPKDTPTDPAARSAAS
jgi:hypothetical protein